VNAIETLEKPISKRYKSYPLPHFTRLRKRVHMFILNYMIRPWFVSKYKMHVYGRQNIPRVAPYIVASNHISMLDPLVISLGLQYPVAYMAKRELFEKWWAAEFFRLVGTFALDRDNPDSATLKTAFNVLRSPAKWVLGIFPEGTRSLTGEVLPLKKGVGGLAQKTKTPVLPVGIFRDASGELTLTIGELMTNVTDPDKIQEQVYEALVHLSNPDWDRNATP
jgi:1-acyl-sn-glycerol-3-phosphate acyltransferase